MNTEGKTVSDITIGDVFMMNFTGVGSEQTGWRPGLVFQNNVGNRHSPCVIALPLTSSIKKKRQPTHVLIRAAENGLAKDSMVLCENPQRMSKDSFGKYITRLDADQMREIACASLLATSAICFIPQDELIGIRERAAALNAV